MLPCRFWHRARPGSPPLPRNRPCHRKDRPRDWSDARRHVFGEGALITPQYVAGLGLDGEQLVSGRRHEHHAIVDDRRRLMALRLPGGKTPDRLQPAHVVAIDLLERAVTPA